MNNYVDANLFSVISLSDFFKDSSNDMKKILHNMEDTIASLSECWKGDDSIEFIDNAISYIENLHSDAVDLNTFSSQIKKDYLRYNAKIDKCREILRRG